VDTLASSAVELDAPFETSAVAAGSPPEVGNAVCARDVCLKPPSGTSKYCCSDCLEKHEASPENSASQQGIRGNTPTQDDTRHSGQSPKNNGMVAGLMFGAAAPPSRIRVENDGTTRKAKDMMCCC